MRKFPTAYYAVYSLECTSAQKEAITAKLHHDFEKRWSYHYAVLGIPFLLGNVAFYQKNHYTCTSYISRLLAQNGIKICDKHFSLVNPRDFIEYSGLTKIFEGPLSELVEKEVYSVKAPSPKTI